MSSRQLERGLSWHFCGKRHPHGDNFGRRGRQCLEKRSLAPHALSIMPWLHLWAENTVFLWPMSRRQPQKEHGLRSPIWCQPGLTHQPYRVTEWMTLNELACLLESWCPQLWNEDRNTHSSVDSEKECRCAFTWPQTCSQRLDGPGSRP